MLVTRAGLRTKAIADLGIVKVVEVVEVVDNDGGDGSHYLDLVPNSESAFPALVKSGWSAAANR